MAGAHSQEKTPARLTAARLYVQMGCQAHRGSRAGQALRGSGELHAIGKAELVSGKVLSDCKALAADELAKRVKKAFSFKPADIVRELGLKNPIFLATTNYGHFGKYDLPWEKLDRKKLDKLKS